MALSASGLLIATILDVFDVTQLAVAPLADTVKCAMYTNVITNDLSTDVGYSAAPFTTNEIPGTGNYTTGGVPLGTKTFSALTASQATFDAADTSWATSTITNARGALIYDDTLVGKNGLCVVNFGADYSTVAGTFQITWNAAGIFYIDCY